MPIYVSNIRIGIDDQPQRAFDIAQNRLRVSIDKIKNIYISKKSLDARHRDKISFVVTVGIELKQDESEVAKAISDDFVTFKSKNNLIVEPGSQKLKRPIAIIGFGPAGIFAAYLLSLHGYNPVVYERGGDMSKRTSSVQNFWENGILDDKNNVQFGEGGAGTFSDGKLTTRISDSRCDFVLDTLYKNGAPSEILENSKPHIGTDKLRNIIVSIRQEIEKNGGKVIFNSKLENINTDNGKIRTITVNGQEIETDVVVLAIGHSARDTFRMLLQKNTTLESKPFSVGVRIEQLQTRIDHGLYGDLAGHKNLPKGEYQLSQRCNSRAVYTFCMCPGGLVVPSASEENHVVTNGMSMHARDNENANSALVVSVDKDDYGNGPLDGVVFQEKLEAIAFELGNGNYKAPFMTVGDFMSAKSFNTNALVTPSYSLGVTQADLHQLFPNEIDKMLRLGLQSFDKKLPGFSATEGILTGVETRTSSPVRIPRDSETLESISFKGLYPCGEGAGYAGGIMSAAVDGIKIAQKIISKFST